MDKSETFESILKQTKVLRLPEHNLATFGVTDIQYFLLIEMEQRKTGIREGRVLSQRPKIVVPQRPPEIFEGFGEDTEKYAEEIFQRLGSDSRIMEYRFKNNATNFQVVSSPFKEVYQKINDEIDKDAEKLSAIIKGVGHAWQASLMKFIVEVTMKSLYSNITELYERGFFGNPEEKEKQARERIEKLFQEAQKDRTRVSELGRVLHKSGLFEEYQDQFFKLFK